MLDFQIRSQSLTGWPLRERADMRVVICVQVRSSWAALPADDSASELDSKLQDNTRFYCGRDASVAINIAGC